MDIKSLPGTEKAQCSHGHLTDLSFIEQPWCSHVRNSLLQSPVKAVSRVFSLLGAVHQLLGCAVMPLMRRPRFKAEHVISKRCRRRWGVVPSCNALAGDRGPTELEFLHWWSNLGFPHTHFSLSSRKWACKSRSYFYFSFGRLHWCSVEAVMKRRHVNTVRRRSRACIQLVLL